MSNWDDDDERLETPELLAEAVAHATDFLFDACPGEATRITRGPDGEFGAIFILRDPEHIAAFTKLYIETFREMEERVDVVACNVRPDYESN
jgi:hypothetical protein